MAPEVERLLGSQSAYLRKKAALCAIRVVRKVPQLLDNMVDPALKLLKDRHHGVLLCAMQLLMTLAEAQPSLVSRMRSHVTDLVRILKSLVLSGYTPDHDVSGITDPFLQVKVRPSFLADAKSSLGDAKSSLADAKSSLADTKTPRLRIELPAWSQALRMECMR